MFADACDKAREYTKPVVLAIQRIDGQCVTAVGSFVVVNREGWVLSAKHIADGISNIEQTIANVQTYQTRLAAVSANSSINKGKRKAQIAALGKKPPSDASSRMAVQWGWGGSRLTNVSFLGEADLLLGKLEPFDPTWVSVYPSFRDPATIPLRQATPLCRIGFPFDNLKVTCDASGNFSVTQNVLPMFPIDGIYTRDVHVGPNPAGYMNMFLETSSPGFRGHSGGPIIDSTGAIWAIQSQTRHLDLGFDVDVLQDGTQRPTGRKERQFFNVGWGAHPVTVCGFLREKGVSFTVAT